MNLKRIYMLSTLVVVSENREGLNFFRNTSKSPRPNQAKEAKARYLFGTSMCK